MKVFLIKIAQYTALIVLFFIVLLIMPYTPRFKKQLLFAKIDKDILLKTTKSPRIIFIGGSNLCFGFNSQVFADSLHLNPVNTAVHFGIGIVFMLDNTLKYVKKGDIIVIAEEYDQYFDDFGYGTLGDNIFIASTVNNPIGFMNLRPIQLYYSAKYVPNLLFTKLQIRDYTDVERDKNNNNNVYLRSAFNKYGDAIGHYNQKNRPFVPRNSFGSKFNYQIMDVLKSFIDSAEKKGAVCYVSFPSLQYKTYLNCIHQINQVDNEFKHYHLKVLGNPKEFTFGDEYMFDNVYHLDKKGVDMRSRNLYLELKKKLAN